MTNALFQLGRQGILDGTISMSVATIKVALVKGYTFNNAHEFVSDVTTAGGTVGTGVALTSKAYADGVFNAANVDFGTVASDPTNNYSVLLYQASAVTGGADVAATAQRVIAWIDTGTNYPINPNGGDVAVDWDTGANKIFAL